VGHPAAPHLQMVAATDLQLLDVSLY